MPKSKSRSAGAPHPAAIGLQHYMRNTPDGKSSEVMRELARTTGMNRFQILSHIGSRVMSGQKPKGPTQDEIEAEQRLAKLSMK
jgi:hypothetical protein